MEEKKLYVGSLPYKTSEGELHELFSQFGPVASVKIVSDRVTGQSKGFAFVEMANAADAQKAIEGTNGSQFGGRNLIVSVARPPQERGERGGDREGGGGYNRDRSRRGGGFGSR